MFDLDADQKEIDLADNNVLQVVSIERKEILLDVWFDALLSKHEKHNANYKCWRYLDLLYSNSMWRQSSIPTSILIELLPSGGMTYECTQMSCSLTTSAIRRRIVTLTKYLYCP